MATASCLVCGGRGTTPRHPGVVECRTCGYVFADLDLTDEDFVRLYDRRYFFGDEYSDYLADRKVLQKNFRLRLSTLSAFLDPQRHRRLFEIGSAYGFFLELARDRFQDVAGIDVAEDAVRHAREQLHLNVSRGDFLDAPLDGQRLDVVCMWDTIEHLRRPDRYLERVSRLVGRGGLLAITTGDVRSLNARWRGRSWRLMHPPTHAHYFSPATLGRLLGNHGFDVVYNRYCGFYRSLDNAAYNVLVLRRNARFLYDLLRRSGIAKIDLYLNLYDIMYVIARRR